MLVIFNKRTSMVLICGIILSISLLSIQAHATTYTLDVPVYKQEQSNWCWAATSESVLSFYGVNPSQSDIVKSVFGSVVNHTANINQDFNSEANFMTGFDSYSQPIIADKPFAFSSLTSLLSKQTPVRAKIIWKDGSGAHDLVIYSCDDVAYTLAYIDPSDGTKKTVPYSYFLNNSSYYWFGSIYYASKPVSLSTGTNQKNK